MSALKDVPCYLVSFNDKGFITEVNEGFCSALVYSNEELITRKFDEILTLGGRIFFQTHFYPLIKLHGSFNEIYLNFRAKDGADIPVLLNAILKEHEGGYTISCVGIRISQRVQFEKELREARRTAEDALQRNEELVKVKQQLEQYQEELDKRLAMLEHRNADLSEMNIIISHDLQEPLRKVSILIDRFVHDKASLLNREDIDYLEKVMGACRRMRYLLESLQTYGSLIREGVTFIPVGLNIIIERVKKEYADSITSNNAIVSCDDLPEVQGNSELLFLLFKNLMDNSLKFVDPDKPFVSISITCAVVEENIFKKTIDKYRYEKFARITFADNGIGFDTKYVNQIFALFRKLNAGTIYTGEGLGLAIAKKIVEMHNGTLTGDSKPGVGTVMTIMLPLEHI